MNESSVLRSVRLRLGSRPDVRLFRNNVGFDHEKKVNYGLFKGSADLIGWQTVTVTPDMVGKKLAVFLSVETKSKKGVVSSEQENWTRIVRAKGGIAVVAKSGEEAEGGLM